jgi:hypothetical protein
LKFAEFDVYFLKDVTIAADFVNEICELLVIIWRTPNDELLPSCASGF